MANDLFGEANSRLVGRANIGRSKRDPPHLRRRCVRQLSATVADIDVPQPRQAVDVFAALGVAQHRALAFGDDQRLPVIIRMMQRVNEKSPVAFEQLSSAVHGVPLPLAFCGYPYRARPNTTIAGSATRRLPFTIP